MLHNGLTLSPPQLVFPKITISRDEGSDWLRANRHKGLGREGWRGGVSWGVPPQPPTSIPPYQIMEGRGKYPRL